MTIETTNTTATGTQATFAQAKTENTKTENTSAVSDLLSDSTEKKSDATQTSVKEQSSDKTDGQKQNGDNKEGDKTAQTPKEYADFKLPEGVNLDEKAIGEFKDFAKEVNLSQEQAQKFMDLNAKWAQEDAKAVQADFSKMVDGWKAETNALPNIQEEMKFADKAVQRFGSSELAVLLKNTGLGVNKEFVSMLIKVGKQISEDKFIEGNRGGDKKFEPQKVYNKSNMNP